MSFDKEQQLLTSEGELPPCSIWIDREGDWYYQGSPMQRGDIVSHLCQHLQRDESTGLYLIRMEKQQCYLEVEDTPLVVTAVFHREKTVEQGKEEILLSLKHLEAKQVLNPASLWVGDENVLYCKVMQEQIPARFLRPAYYQLAEFIDEDRDQKRFYLLLGGKRYYIG